MGDQGAGGPQPPSDAESAKSRTPPRAHSHRVVQPMPSEDIDAIADALYKKMMPDVSRLLVGLLEPAVARARAPPNGGPAMPGLAAGSSASAVTSARGEGATVGNTAGPDAADMRLIVREELDAFGERRAPGLVARQAETVKAVTEAVQQSVVQCLQEKPVDMMTDDEIHKAVLAALPTKTIRKHHGPVLNQSIHMFMEDARYEGDALTTSFPPSSPLLETLVNEGFMKIVLGIVERIYNANAELSAENQPHVFKGKDHVMPDSLDRVDRAVVNVTRNGLHDPRCKTRRLVVVLFMYYMLNNAGSMKLSQPDAVKPAPTEGADSPYFAVQMKLLASCSGLLPVGDVPAAVHSADPPANSPLAGVHEVVREANLYDIARAVLAKLVREPHVFDPEVEFSIAVTLRTIMLEPDTSWTKMDHKYAEEIQGTGTWALLLPRVDVRADASQMVQTLTTKEKDDIMAKHRETTRSAMAEAEGGADERGSAPAAGTGAGSSSALRTPSSASTAWLRRLAR